MSRSVPHILAFGLVALMWMSLAPQSSHGQINFAPPRGANAISPTMSTTDRSTPDRPVTQASKAQDVTADHQVARREAETKRSTTPTVTVSSSSASGQTPELAQPSSFAPAVFPFDANDVRAPAPYTSMLYPAYLRSLNVRDEDPESPTQPETVRSSEETETSLSPPRSERAPSDHIQVSSYRFGRTL